jgi:hypothetical protein
MFKVDSAGVAQRVSRIDEAKAIVAKGGKIGPELTLDLLDEEADRKGRDYVYTNAQGETAALGRFAIDCTNLHRVLEDDGSFKEFVPGCIVGALSVDLFGLERTPEAGGAYSLNSALGDPFDGLAERILVNVQSRQDEGHAWGVAVDKAREWFADELP